MLFPDDERKPIGSWGLALADSTDACGAPRPATVPIVQVVASESALATIREQGGRLYVWVRKGRCCGGTQTLATSSEPPPGTDFRRVEAAAGFELFMPSRLGRLPDELHVELRRFPRRIEAYWDGCVWVV